MLRAACLALTAAAVACAMPIADELAADPFNPRIATAMGYRPVPGAKLAHASCIHTVPSGAVARKHPDTGAWVYRDPTDATGAEVALPKCAKPLIRRARPSHGGRSGRSGRSGHAAPTQHGPAWIVDAMQESAQAFSYFSTNFTVPPDPTSVADQLIYYWPGTETEAESDVVQPVLQFGVSDDGGGSFWIFASWYVSGDGTVLTSTPTDAIPVGTPLFGSIQLVGSNYVSTGVAPGISGSPTVLSVANTESQLQTRAYVTVEIYNFDTCDETPPSNALAFTDIVLIDGSGAPVKANFTAETQHQQCNHGIKLGPDSVTITWSS